MEHPEPIPQSAATRTPATLSGRWQLALLAVLAALVGYHLWFAATRQKALCWDTAVGFLTLQSSLETGTFNRLHHPDPLDIAGDTSEFIVWWTPGQYLVPHGVARLLGTDVGNALRVVCAAASLLGVIGYGLLLHRLGLSRVAVALSLIVICSQEYFLTHGRVYWGGELLLFAVAPYLLWGVLAVRRGILVRAGVAALACYAAMLAKATVLMVFAGLSLYLALEAIGWPVAASAVPAAPRDRWRRIAGVALVFLAFVLVVRWSYLAQGETISDSARAWDSWSRLGGVAVALSGPLLATLTLLESLGTPALLLPGALLAGFLTWQLGRQLEADGMPEYRRLLTALYVAAAVFYGYAYLRGMGISAEPRHYRVVGLLLLPALVHWLLARGPARAVTVGLLGLAALGVVRFHAEHYAGPAESSASRWNIRQPISNSSLAVLHQIDATEVGRDTIVYSGFGAAPGLLLEFEHGRKLFDTYHYTLAGVSRVPRFRGEAGSIIMVVSRNQRWYFGPPLAEIARNFEFPLQVALIFENEEMSVYRGRVGARRAATDGGTGP